MAPADAVKLAFQNEFGAAHLDDGRDEEREIGDEMRLAQVCSRDSAEYIGNRGARLFLTSREGLELGAGLVSKIFDASLKAQGSAQGFESKLFTLRQAVADNLFSFAAPEYDGWLEKYRREGCPPPGHSKIYKESYKPHYRVVDSYYIRLLGLIGMLADRLKHKPRLIVGIDGMAASGKTTAAQLLKKVFDASIIHADHFFLPEAMRTENRLKEPGGNFHRERFESEVIELLGEAKEFLYRPYNCKTKKYDAPRMVAPRALTIIEGAYCLHPAIASRYDLKVFIRVGPEEQHSRIQKRNGKLSAKDFADRWIPLENRYIKELEIENHCDLVI